MVGIRSKLSSLREYLTPINYSSNFRRTGEISPAEFVKAGDYLVYKFPTWEWGRVSSKQKREFLPEDKQFLVTRHVPSYQRAASYLGEKSTLEEEEEIEGEDGWVKSHRINLGGEDKEQEKGPERGEEGDIQDIDEFIDESAEQSDRRDENDFEEIVESGNDSNLRRYDMYIMYSTSYRVPKVYLVGFSSSGIPLLPEQMFEDITADYKDKTATIENLPVAYNTIAVSIHPCKHASVMRTLMAHSSSKRPKATEAESETGANPGVSGAAETQEEEDIRVDQYMVTFLKFIASVTPGIEYDYTMDAL